MIVRTQKTKNYSVIDNRVLEDWRISFKTKGILAFLLTKPDGWQVITQHLINAGPDGRHAVESALEEAERFGYIEHGEQPRGEGGRFDAVTTIVHEEPLTGFPKPRKSPVRADAGNQQRAKEQVQADAENPFAENPFAENQRLVSTEETSTEEGITPSRAFASKIAGGYVFKFSDARLNFAAQALFYSIEAVLPDAGWDSIALFVVEKVQQLDGEFGEVQASFAIAAVTDRLSLRSSRVDAGKAEPVEKLGFVTSVIQEVVEAFERNGCWTGTDHSVCISDVWSEFVSDWKPVVREVFNPTTGEMGRVA